jgi:UDP-3-O-[3-hydroxymyristoyl] glucosamine N-acyltransferase
MNKYFFKIQKKILLSDILKCLNISHQDFFNINPNFGIDVLQNEINDFVSFDNLKVNKLSFFNNKKNNYMSIHSGFCVVKIENIQMLSNSIIKIPFHNPKLGFSKILDIYFKKYNFNNNNNNKIHPTAIIHKTAFIGKNVSIGAYTNIDEGVIIEDNTFIGDRVNISYNSKIGKRSFVSSGVFIEFSVLGNDVVIAPNTVIGKLGFGFIPDKSNTFLIPHIGAVVIGDGTNIGSGCTIDRGLIDDTIIGCFVMIDNLVHIGHNCIIDDFCVLAGQVGLSGSVKLEKNIVIGGDVSIKDNITIGENSIIAGASKVFNNFPKNSKIGGNPAQDLIGWQRLIILQKQELRKRKFKKNDS